MSSLRKNYITNKPNGWTFSDIPSNPSTSLERFPNSSANVGLYNNNSIQEASTIVKQLVATSLLQFGATSFSMPFEVGKLLLQVQYTPKNRQQHQQSEQELIESEESDDDKDVSLS